ncbi:hypothetical protein [Halomonas cibimaris]
MAANVKRQQALVQAALMLLYRNTSKQEGQRYSLDTRFYLKQYRSESHRFLALQRQTSGKLRALCGLSPDICRASEVARLTKRHDLIVSHSVLEWAPASPMLIGAIRFELQDDWYELPWIVAEHGLDTILKRFNAVDRYDYNGLTLATHHWQATPDCFTLQFQKSFYYNYLATNLLPEFSLPGGLTYRDLLEPGPQLSKLDSALPENHLGISCLLRTCDGALIIPRRSQHTNVFKGQLSPSISGAANNATCRDPDGGYSALAWLVQELTEELPFLATSPDAFPTPLHQYLGGTGFLGMTRELRRCGKPELFFFLQLPIDAAKVRMLWAQHRHPGNEEAALTALQGIDHNENAGLIVIDEEQLFQRITTQVIQSKRRWPNPQQADFHVVLPKEGKDDVLSESLLANLILYRLSQ